MRCHFLSQIRKLNRHYQSSSMFRPSTDTILVDSDYAKINDMQLEWSIWDEREQEWVNTVNHETIVNSSSTSSMSITEPLNTQTWGTTYTAEPVSLNTYRTRRSGNSSSIKIETLNGVKDRYIKPTNAILTAEIKVDASSYVVYDTQTQTRLVDSSYTSALANFDFRMYNRNGKSVYIYDSIGDVSTHTLSVAQVISEGTLIYDVTGARIYSLSDAIVKFEQGASEADYYKMDGYLSGKVTLTPSIETADAVLSVASGFNSKISLYSNIAYERG